jgi:hypothetical protein
VFSALPELAEVASDARDTHAQMGHFLRLTESMRVSRREAAAIVEAMQLCERAHGYAVIAQALVFAAAVVENAVALTGVTITALGEQRGHASPGLLVGAVIETRAGIDPPRRRFPNTRYEPRLGSPRVEFEDCLAGVGLAVRLGLLNERTQPAPLSGTQPYSALACSFRRERSIAGAGLLSRMADEALADEALADRVLAGSAQSDKAQVSRPGFPAARFAQLVSREAGNGRLPGAWLQYVRRLRP